MLKVSFKDIRVIENHNPDCESGYWFVNRSKNSWSAKVFGVQIGPAVKNASDAAKYVVSWLKDAYGDRWVDFFRYRSEKPAYPIKINNKWQMVVYYLGEKKILGPKCSDRKSIIAWFKDWKKKDFGICKPETIIRCCTPSDFRIDKIKSKQSIPYRE
jgi:hypothetical protein